MIRLQRCILFLVCLASATSAFSYPNFLDDFRKDPFRRPEVDGCQTCHMSPQGGDARNPFGLAFTSAGTRITTMLRAQFPDRFAYPTSRGAGNTVFHFADPSNKQLVVETAGLRMLVDVEGKSVDGAAATGGPGGAGATARAAAPQAVETSSRVDPYAREGAFFGMNIVNLPNGKPIRKGGVDFTIQHRFSRDVDAAGFSELFGFDSSATILFGARVGITDRWSFGFARSNLKKTVELSSTFNLVRQSPDGAPLTLAVRAGMEGTHNFHRRHSPYIQPIATTTFGDRVSFSVSPIFAFNTNDEDSFLPPDFRFGEDHDDTISLGLGTGIRLFPTTSLVGEFIPRLWGFKGEIYDRPGVAIGIQKSTFRHTFELLVSRQQPMTTSQYTVQGDDKFKIGFNIYRRVR